MKHDIVTERNQVCQEETEVKPDSIKRTGVQGSTAGSSSGNTDVLLGLMF